MRLPIQAKPVIRYDTSSISRDIGLGIDASAYCTCQNSNVKVDKCGERSTAECFGNGSRCRCV